MFAREISGVFNEMLIHNVPRTVFSYTALINAYGRHGQYEIAFELLNKMKRERVVPNILTYKTLSSHVLEVGWLGRSYWACLLK